MSGPSEEHKQKMEKVWNKFRSTAEKILEDKGLNKAGFFVFRPHNLFMGFDRSKLFFVLSYNNAVMGMRMTHQSDMTQHGYISLDQVLKSCMNQFGYQSPVGLVLPRNIMDMEESELDAALIPIVENVITEAIKRSEGSRSKVI